MALWGWFIGYVVLFALLHLLLYYLYARGDDDDGGERTPSLADPNRARVQSSPGPDRYPRAADDIGDADLEHDSYDLEFDGETIRCPHCGAPNETDPAFSYCWNCISGIRK